MRHQTSIKHMKCEVCGYTNPIDVLNLGNQPLCDDLIPLEADQRSQLYPLQIKFCPNCHTALQTLNIDQKNLFPPNYHYRARNTPSVLTSMEQLVDITRKEFLPSLNNLKVLDIGCNDGSLLKFFASKGARVYGIDPTDAIQEATFLDCAFQDFFSPYTALKIKERIGYPDIVTFTNCFAHISNMAELMVALSTLMGPETLVIIENHYLKTVIERNQFDTFYHEHPRTYSAKSFQTIANLLSANLLKLETTTRYGGNIRAFLSRSNKLKKYSIIRDDYNFAETFKQMDKFIPEWIIKKRQEIQEYTDIHGPLVGIGFPGRASILINLLNLTTSHLSATYEIKGSIKTGHYIPGTRIPILPEEILFCQKNKPSTIFNLAWHIEDDVRANLSSYDYHPTFINIL